MHIIYLPGNSAGNKDWIEKVKAKFDKFSAGEILYYDHWQTGQKWLNLTAESAKLAKMVEGQKDYFVFAKSAGCGLALKNIFEKKFNPQKAIFCGFPTVRYLEYPLPPTIFVQNGFDPVCSFEKLAKALAAVTPVNFKLIKNPGIHSHDYDNFDQLATLAKNFFNTKGVLPDTP